MKKKKWFILAVLIAYTGFVFYKYNERTNVVQQVEDERLTVVTSFYPMYIHTSALMKGTPHQLVNMADQTVGCLHDYQLTVEDTKKLYNADVFIANGLGSEAFMEKAYKQNEQMQVINASDQIEDELEAAYEAEYHHEDEHLHEEDDHLHEDEHLQEDDEHLHNHAHVNDHIWLSIEGTKAQVTQIANELSKIDPTYAPIYEANAKAYVEALDALKEEGGELLQDLESPKAVSIHDAFYYLAKEWGIDLVATLPEGSYENASAAEIEKLIEKMEEEEVEVIFTEEKYKDLAIVKTIQREVDSKVYVLDALLSEEDQTLEAETMEDGFVYVTRMRENIKKIREAYSNE